VASAHASLHVEEHPGREPATVWLHHGVGSTRAWDAFVPAIADGRRTLAYDRRGFGQSSHARRFTTVMFDEDVDDLRSVLAERRCDRVHLIGHSDGGTVALLLAARSPELVVSVTVVAVHVRGDAATVATLRRMGPPTDWPETMQRSLRRAHGPDWAGVAGGWHALWTSTEWEDWSIVDALPAIRCPVLAFHGMHDALAPTLHADMLLAVLPDTTVTWVDTSTHDPHRVAPQQFSAAVQALWQRSENIDD
jgi:pimeloyl-ACP methyl ester carboxylesterase